MPTPTDGGLIEPASKGTIFASIVLAYEFVVEPSPSGSPQPFEPAYRALDAKQRKTVNDVVSPKVRDLVKDTVACEWLKGIEVEHENGYVDHATIRSILRTALEAAAEPDTGSSRPPGHGLTIDDGEIDDRSRYTRIGPDEHRVSTLVPVHWQLTDADGAKTTGGPVTFDATVPPDAGGKAPSKATLTARTLAVLTWMYVDRTSDCVNPHLLTELRDESARLALELERLVAPRDANATPTLTLGDVSAQLRALAEDPRWRELGHALRVFGQSRR